MSALFLSYRRDDSAGFAGRLADALENAFGPGSVFRDIDDIGPGQDFIHAIESQLREVRAVLVMIGPHWLAVGADGRRRLDAPDDFVHLEIKLTLASGKPLIPLLVGGARMPAEADLPPALAGLARRQAVVLSDVHWRSDIERLAESLRPLVSNGVSGDARPRPRRWMLGVAGVAVALLVAFAGIRLLTPAPRATPPTLIAPRPAADIVGRWSARVQYDWGDTYDEVFVFKMLGGKLHGTATYLKGRLTIEHASLRGDWLRFTTRSQEMLGDSPWKEARHAYTGRVTPAGIAFTLETTGGYSVHPPIEFLARRSASPAPVTATPRR